MTKTDAIDFEFIEEQVNEFEKERLNEAIKGIEQDSKNGEGKPMFLNVIKGRFTGRSNLAVTYYGAYGYFEGKRATDRESQELYSLFD